MTDLELRITSPVDTVVQVGRIVVAPRPGTVAGVPADVPGHEAEVVAVVELVRAGASVVVVHGAPGSGATAVALAAATRLEADFPGGARFAPDPARAEPAEPTGRPTLLVLDDVTGADQVRAVLPRAGSAVIAVSPAPLPALGLEGGAQVAVRATAITGPHALHTLRSLRSLSEAERTVLAAAVRLVRAGAATVDAESCGALVGADVTAPLRALRARGLLSPRPGPDGLTCAVPRAVRTAFDAAFGAAYRTAFGAGPETGPASPSQATREPDTVDTAAPALPAPAPPTPAPPDPDLLDAVLTRVEARLHAPDAAPDPVTAALAVLAVAEASGDRAALGRAALALADALAAGPEQDRARRAYDAVVTTATDDDLQAAALRGRGLLAARRGRTAAALVDLRAAVALQQTAGAVTAAATWVAIGETERAAGHPCPAVSAFRAALATLAEHGDRLADTWTALARGRVQTGPLPALRLPDGLAGRAVRALAELDPTAPAAALVVALSASGARAW
ncbi:hypothetical protein [Pseudonocardia oroxyli]|uniref:Uncharacterized protein n=1 Tax=Pseudonocardia oroxyli TaxID=366584 RepID=A0A1G7XKE3_PSEOR|nr:hypothetical protein [Pseudonocardia oroxyli]SDG84674.1 hypothetical protein SAMN05216377_1169 [Pseudonocardia oroxyli]